MSVYRTTGPLVADVFIGFVRASWKISVHLMRFLSLNKVDVSLVFSRTYFSKVSQNLFW